MSDLDLDSAEILNVSIPFGEMIDVEFDATDDNGDPVTLTGVWSADIFLHTAIALTLTEGNGLTISGSTVTVHFGYILSQIGPNNYYWRMRKIEGGLSTPIWKGFFNIRLK